MRPLARFTMGLGVVLCAAVGAALAQPRPHGGVETYGQPAATPFDRDSLHPTPVTLYGLFNAGWARLDASPHANPCGASVAAAHTGIDSVERSRIGLTAVEVLSGGQRAHLEIEQSIRVDAGEVLLPCRAWDARETVGLSDRAWGRVDLGRVEQAASSLVQRADPWRGSGAASPGWRTYLAAPAVGVRSSATVAYETPQELPLKARLNVSLRSHDAQQGREHGAAVMWDRLPWLVGLGWQVWPDGSRAMPLVVVHDSGALRWSGALTRGRLVQTRYQNLFIAASGPIMATGDPERHVWRVGLDLHRVNGGGPPGWRSEDKLGLGWRYRFSRRAWVSALRSYSPTKACRGLRSTSV